MDIALVAILMFVLVAAMFVWWLMVLIEALRAPESQWQAAGQSRLLYVLLMVFLGVIGTIVYVIAARPQLRKEAGTA